MALVHTPHQRAGVVRVHLLEPVPREPRGRVNIVRIRTSNKKVVRVHRNKKVVRMRMPGLGPAGHYSRRCSERLVTVRRQ